MIMHLWSRTAVADKEGLTSKIGPYDTGLPSKPVVRWQRYDQRCLLLAVPRSGISRFLKSKPQLIANEVIGFDNL